MTTQSQRTVDEVLAKLEVEIDAELAKFDRAADESQDLAAARARADAAVEESLQRLRDLAK